MIGRLEKIIKDSGKNKKEFAISIGASPGNVGDWLKGRSEPSSRYLLRIHEIYGVDILWLLTGESEKDHSLSMTVNEPAPTYNKERVRVREIMKILYDHPDLEDHIYHYLKSLITKPK